MSIRQYQKQLEKITDGKKFYLVLHSFKVSRYQSHYSEKNIQLQIGMLLSGCTAKFFTSNLSSLSGYFTVPYLCSTPNHYQIEDDIDGTSTVVVSSAEMRQYTQCLDVIQAGILISIKTLSERIEVFHHTLTRAINAKCGDAVMVNGVDLNYMIEAVCLLDPNKINIVFEVSSVM